MGVGGRPSERLAWARLADGCGDVSGGGGGALRKDAAGNDDGAGARAAVAMSGEEAGEEWSVGATSRFEGKEGREKPTSLLVSAEMLVGLGGDERMSSLEEATARKASDLEAKEGGLAAAEWLGDMGRSRARLCVTNGAFEGRGRNGKEGGK